MPKKENLILWEKGQSGNPRGRPKGSKNRSTILKELAELRTKGIHPVTGEEVWMTNEYRMAMAVIEKVIEKGDHQALNMVLDNIYGKQKDSVDIHTSEEVNHDFRNIIARIKAQ
jgi:hypothetical protein|tara:strand:+ start:28 stop:369 length:342 start_codon:yes stop_codon:yes gene_type:complete